MEWSPQIAAAMAHRRCPDCRGTGRPAGVDQRDLCRCVYRAVFHVCHRRFEQYSRSQRHSFRRISFEPIARGVDRSRTWVRRIEDYRADFHACGMRSLARHLYQFFSFYYLHGATQELVCRRLGVSARQADDWMAEIEVTVGREIAHLEPYSLFPPKGYMLPVRRGPQADSPIILGKTG
jgi:hypothetical protein